MPNPQNPNQDQQHQKKTGTPGTQDTQARQAKGRDQGTGQQNRDRDIQDKQGGRRDR